MRNSRLTIRGLLIAAAILAYNNSVIGAEPAAPSAVAAPANAAAEVLWEPADGSLKLRYHGATILEGKILVQTDADKRPAKTDEVVLKQSTTGKDKVEQVLNFSLAQHNAAGRLVFQGMAHGSEESFAAETLSDAQKRFPLVRTSVGQSHNLRNNSIYDRHFDWLLTGPSDGRTNITASQQGGGPVAFAIECKGQDVALVFRPRYYQQHRGLKHFTPWTYKVRQDSISGWCSWWAYMGGFDERMLKSLLEVWRKRHMGDYGYHFIQIDECYERGTGLPENWLHWNDRFPAGMEGYVKAVKEAGFTPAVWTNAAYNNVPAAPAKPEWFLHKDGKPYEGSWVGYTVDSTIPAAADTIVKPIYRGYHDAGFGYVKIDALRHCIYDGINQCLPDVAARGVAPDALFRRYLQLARAELGEKTYILACWGVLPEAIGLVDGCRLAGDGFGPSSLQCYNSWNGVVWRNDPDHCDVMPARHAVESGNVTKTEAVAGDIADSIIRPTLVSMAGGMLMLSDKAEVYRDSKAVEGARRAGPVLFSVPGQMYDYDPTYSAHLLTAARTAFTGGGAMSPLDAPQNNTVCPWWLMEVDRPFEHWAVLSRLNFSDKPLPAATVRFRDLGLGDDQLVWEFWTRRLVAVHDGGFAAEPLRSRGTRTYAIRPRLDRPQVLSTSRHISQGGADLITVKWDPATRTLSGRSRVVTGDAYELAIHVPAPFVCRKAVIAGTAVEARLDGEVLRVTHTPAETSTIDWSLQF